MTTHFYEQNMQVNSPKQAVDHSRNGINFIPIPSPKIDTYHGNRTAKNEHRTNTNHALHAQTRSIGTGQYQQTSQLKINGSRTTQKTTGAPPSKRPRMRPGYINFQKNELEKEFRKSRHLTRSRHIDISQRLLIDENQIKRWFENRTREENNVNGAVGSRNDFHASINSCGQNSFLPQLEGHTIPELDGKSRSMDDFSVILIDFMLKKGFWSIVPNPDKLEDNSLPSVHLQLNSIYKSPLLPGYRRMLDHPLMTNTNTPIQCTNSHSQYQPSSFATFNPYSPYPYYAVPQFAPPTVDHTPGPAVQPTIYHSQYQPPSFAQYNPFAPIYSLGNSVNVDQKHALPNNTHHNNTVGSKRNSDLNIQNHF